jgi:amino-acid N-acetyltransferase
MYEGTRMAREEDLSGIRKIIRPLEESGVLVRRTDQEVIIFSSCEQNID